MNEADQITVADYEEAFKDHRRLVRELDVLLNGDSAAKQASLCDIVAQLKRESAERLLCVDWKWLVKRGGIETNQYANSNDVKMLHWPGTHLCWKEQCRSCDGVHRAFVIGKSGYVGHLNRGGFSDLLRVLQSST